MGKLLNLSKINNSIKSFKSSIFSAKKTTFSMRKFLLKKTKVKKEEIQGKKTFLGRKKEYERRKENEIALEAKEIVSSPIKAIVKATGGFLSRILSFLGTLLLGWLMNNLPTIIAMAQELIARIQRMFQLLQGFIGNILNIMKDFGSLLLAVFQNVISFDFFDTSNRVKNSLTDLEKTFTDMGSQVDEGIRLATTSLDKAIAPGGPGEIPAFGTDYTQEPTSAPDASGYATAGLSGVSQQRIGNDIEFLKEVKRVSQKYGLKEGDLLGLIASESGFDPAAGQIGGHVGLIQFSADSAKSVGTSQAALKRMSRAQQMKYVDKYFENWNLPKGANAGQLYSVVFAPAYASGDPNKVLYSSPSAEYRSNAPLDANKDGKITVSEMGGRIQQKKKEFGISDNISVTERPVAGTSTTELSGENTFIQGNTGNSRGDHFHIGPEMELWNKPEGYAAAREGAFKVAKNLMSRKIPFTFSNWWGFRSMWYNGGSPKSDAELRSAIEKEQVAHRTRPGGGSFAGIDIAAGQGTRIPGITNVKFRPDGFGVSGRISGTNAFVGHGAYGSKSSPTPSSVTSRPTPAPITSTQKPTPPAQVTPTATAAPTAPSITPTPSGAPVAPAAQVSSTQLSQQVSQTIQTSTTPEQQTIFINDVQQPQPVVASSGGGGASAPPSISSLTLLNRFMKHHILLDLAYT